MSDRVPVPMAYYLRDGLVCGYANPSYAVTFGLDARYIVGRNLAEVVGADTLRLVQPHIDRLFAGRNTVRYSRSLTIADGMTRWFDVSLEPHGVAADGTALADDAVAAAAVAVLPLVGAFVLMTDITRFHDAEQALRDSEDRLRKFMDASVEGIAFHRDGLTLLFIDLDHFAVHACAGGRPARRPRGAGGAAWHRHARRRPRLADLRVRRGRRRSGGRPAQRGLRDAAGQWYQPPMAALQASAWLATQAIRRDQAGAVGLTGLTG